MAGLAWLHQTTHRECIAWVTKVHSVSVQAECHGLCRFGDINACLMFPTSQYKFINSVLMICLCGIVNCMVCVYYFCSICFAPLVAGCSNIVQQCHCEGLVSPHYSEFGFVGYVIGPAHCCMVSLNASETTLTQSIGKHDIV